MGEKDIAEKMLAEYNDVFADIVNGLLFKGRQVVKPQELESAQPIAQYKADDGVLHEEERDLSKYWIKDTKIRISLYGIEHQSQVDSKMPFRVIGYDGAAYRTQLLAKREKKEDQKEAEREAQKIVPVVTLVLYFGTDQNWTSPKNLKDLLEIPEELEPYVSDYKINVFEIADLTDEEINRFHSDFRILARFFARKKHDPEHAMDNREEIQHVDEVLKLLSVLTGDSRYIRIPAQERKGIKDMCDVADRIEKKGIAKGRAEGRAEGREEGEEKMSKLVSVLLEKQDYAAIQKVTEDPEIRKEYFSRYGI